MNVAAKFHSPKFHSAMPSHNAEMSHDQVEQSIHSQSRSMGIPGEQHDPTGQSASQFVSQDYGMQRHMAYDSPLVQPAYTKSGKVNVF